MAKHELIVSRTSGEDATLIIAVDKQLSLEDYQEIRLLSPALTAVVGRMRARAWWDDEAHQLIIERDRFAPPLHR